MLQEEQKEERDCQLRPQICGLFCNCPVMPGSYVFKGKKYVIRVRAYRKVDGDMVYTGWSSKKTVRVK